MSTRKYSGENDKLKRHQREQANQARRKVLGWLSENYPAFDTRDQVRPLKIGILEDIFAEAKKHKVPFSKSKIRQVVVMFTNRVEYLVCLKLQRDDRVDLMGKVVAPVTDKEGLVAASILRKRVEKMTRETLNEEKKEKEKKEKKAYDGRMATSYPYRAPVKTETAPAKAPQVVVKRKVSPDRIARMREKLGLPNK